MKRSTHRSICLAVAVCTAMLSTAQKNIDRLRIDLAGAWHFVIDENNQFDEKSLFGDTLLLPGTTDTNHKGHPLDRFDETTHLSRNYSYVGKVWYRRFLDVPRQWKNKSVTLHLERTKPTSVWVNGIKMGSSDDISVAQNYDVSAAFNSQNWKIGQVWIDIMVDNSDRNVPPQLLGSSHAYTEDTQTNWNGIIGDIYLEAKEKKCINDFFVNADYQKATVSIKCEYSSFVKPNDKVKLTIYNAADGSAVASKVFLASDEIKMTLDQTAVRPWSEFHPAMYEAELILANGDKLRKPFGFCDMRVEGRHFLVNGNRTFLRGKHDACVFPLTAHVPMDNESWRKYFRTLKDYGINHVRFHSWCPPEACFAEADKAGIYLQPELPFWGDFNSKDKRLMDYLMDEGKKIVNSYGHHPSFVMMALGNELWGDIDMMKQFTDTLRQQHYTKLMTFGSNYYLGYQGWKEGMDYFTTCRNGGERDKEFNTHTRGSFSFADTYDGGYINHTYPNTVMNFDEAVEACPVPIISHETCQFQMYPNYKEIDKYSGVLRPCNMEIFRKRLEQAGMLDQADEFFLASAAWSALLYRADMEMDLRTRDMAGFQLLDLQDYPGQGSAYIGVLDAFMESKGIIEPEEWRQFCSEIVPLAVMDRFCYSNTDSAFVELKIANYSEQSLQGRALIWQLVDTNGMVCQRGEVNITEGGQGLLELGAIQIPMGDINVPSKMRLSLQIEVPSLQASSVSPQALQYTNDYPLWIYPADNGYVSKEIMMTDTLDAKAQQQLKKGGKVLLMPRRGGVEKATVGGLFQTDYWNYRMFRTISENNKKPVSPGTLGILANPAHPLFRDFPTEAHTNWQWFGIVKPSYPLILDTTPQDYRPIVQVIDNVERNHKLGLVFEFNVEGGKLLVCMSDLKSMDDKPEVRQFITSMLRYMESHDFSPSQTVSLDYLQDLLTRDAEELNINELRNISFE